MPVGSYHGWGICGKQLAMHLAARGPVCLLTEAVNPQLGLDEAEEWCLRALQPGPAEAATLGAGGPVRTAGPVLQAMTDAELTPYRPGLRGHFTVGYVFFEANRAVARRARQASAFYDHIVAGSRWCEQQLRAAGVSQVSTILQGVDPAVFHPAEEPAVFGDRFVVFSGGKLEFRKGQDLVIRAYKVLQDRHRDTLLINSWHNFWPFSLETMAVSPWIRFPGGRPEASWRAFVEALLAANGIDVTRVITLGVRPHATLARIYRLSSVGLFPNRCEGGTNLVLMEFMACGRPAIAAYNTGHCDVVDEGNAVLLRRMRPVTIQGPDGVMADWEEPELEEVVEALEWAYQHREKAAELGRQGAVEMARRSWAETAREFAELLWGGGADSTLKQTEAAAAAERR